MNNMISSNVSSGQTQVSSHQNVSFAPTTQVPPQSQAPYMLMSMTSN
jgi:hypothetical protein